MICSVCGGKDFRTGKILFDELIDAWQLSPDEVAYLDRQQGEYCVTCGANLRSIILAKAIASSLGFSQPLRDVAKQFSHNSSFRLLEINEAGALSSTLRMFSGYSFGAYPEVDMHDLPYPDATFDLIIHSDTLVFNCNF